jgi:ArsR family transcriptional regulator, lead/cadmium/zinc/bismuth-responsive transcriptional repressor
MTSPTPQADIAASHDELEAAACPGLHVTGAEMATLRQALIPRRLIGTLAETFRALGDPTRLRILDALSHAELCVCDLATALGLSESATSHQLRLLRSLRLVRARRAGRMSFYALDDAHITGLSAQGLDHVVEALPASLSESTTPGGRA